MPLMEPKYWTADDVRELPDDGKRYECIDGVLLVTPSPRRLHNEVVLELLFVIREYLKAHAPLRVYSSPSDVEIEAQMLVQPDIFVPTAKRGLERVREWDQIGGLLLAVEVLSPSTASIDRGRKRKFYQRTGVAEYWIVDVDARSVERWRPSDVHPEVVRDVLAWRAHVAAEPLRIDLPALFDAAD